MAMVLNRIFQRFRSPIFGLIKLLAAFHTFWNQQLVFCHRHTAIKRCWHVLDHRMLELWEPAAHRSGWFGRLRPLTRGGGQPSLTFESRRIRRCASLTPRPPSRADVSLDSSAKRLARLSRSAWKCVH